MSETLDQYCKNTLSTISYRQCCKVPQFLPDSVIELCRKRPLPPVRPDVPMPIPENCIAECALNVTRVLIDYQFRVEQARKVLLARTANDPDWAKTIGVAIDKCYRMTVLNAFHLQDVALNRISSQCLPSSIHFLECTFGMAYRDCPDKYRTAWDDKCHALVRAFNSCNFFFDKKLGF
ncbi:uncharacterized protein LOC131294102 [Anopheles ziemanni]|uniref:uncharacterized protein LOC131264835 n=1 Tax=Anopheles coustani TaxID=139045 RepID=UPI002657FF84|nr:uncharacterized protein LOC131264835 [Anopheles coustani]XP_058178131.1 uncharacterized protein LOC131294102 [Anopheles ziemanni]